MRAAAWTSWSLRSDQGVTLQSVRAPRRYRSSSGQCWQCLALLGYDLSGSTAPQNGAVTINGGAAYTSNPTATLALFAEDTPPAGQSGMYQMRIRTRTAAIGRRFRICDLSKLEPRAQCGGRRLRRFMPVSATGCELDHDLGLRDDHAGRTPPTSCSVVIDGGAAEQHRRGDPDVVGNRQLIRDNQYSGEQRRKHMDDGYVRGDVPVDIGSG